MGSIHSVWRCASLLQERDKLFNSEKKEELL